MTEARQRCLDLVRELPEEALGPLESILRELIAMAADEARAVAAAFAEDTDE